MTEPQVWTLIATFAVGMSAMIALVLRVVAVEIGKVTVQIEGLRREMDTRFAHLDRDIQAIAARVFPEN